MKSRKYQFEFSGIRTYIDNVFLLVSKFSGLTSSFFYSFRPHSAIGPTNINPKNQVSRPFEFSVSPLSNLIVIDFKLFSLSKECIWQGVLIETFPFLIF